MRAEPELSATLVHVRSLSLSPSAFIVPFSRKLGVRRFSSIEPDPLEKRIGASFFLYCLIFRFLIPASEVTEPFFNVSHSRDYR